jgi:hypothetical protein
MDLLGSVRNVLRRNRGVGQAFACRYWGTPRTSFRIADVMAVIRTEHFPNSSPKRYLCANQFGEKIICFWTLMYKILNLWTWSPSIENTLRFITNTVVLIAGTYDRRQWTKILKSVFLSVCMLCCIVLCEQLPITQSRFSSESISGS